jgi:hypothetical protein
MKPSPRRIAITVALTCISGSLAAQEALAPLDLTAAGVKAVVQAPQGAKAEKFLSSTRVSKGTTFSFEISEIYDMEFGAARDMAKPDAKSFPVETADTLLWESKQGGFHFYATFKLGGKLHACWDTRPDAYTRAAVDAMLASCRTIKGGGGAAAKGAAAPAPAKGLEALKADAPPGWENPSFGGGTWTFEKHVDEGWNRVYVDALPSDSPTSGDAYAKKLQEKDWQDFGSRWSEIMGVDPLEGGFVIMGWRQSTTDPKAQPELGVVVVRDIGGTRIRCRSGALVTSEELYKEAVRLCVSARF